MQLASQHFTERSAYDESLNPQGLPLPLTAALWDYFTHLAPDELAARIAEVHAAIMTAGITFTVYTDAGNIDRAWPFDVVPRVIDNHEWRHVESGLKQRLSALNLFITDIYNDQRIIRDGIFPAEVLQGSKHFRPACVGMRPRFDVWAHICGTDLVRHSDGQFYVLEDNLRVPSGVSYMLENRQLMKRLFPELLARYHVLPVDNYTAQLYDTLATLSPRSGDRPVIVVLTPGIYNSAYFEHSYLAQQMGAELVEGADLIVGKDDCVYMKNIKGPTRVDVVYRRIDDDFLDPEVFQPDSLLGVRGLMRAWKAGKVGIANAPGAGVADDKVVYAFVPQMIKYYLGQDAILPNVPTYLCMYDTDRAHVLKNLDKLVIKPANESGGYGMLIGPQSTSEERAKFAELITANPRNYIAQPTLSLSSVPTLTTEGIAPRHVDLRPFVLQSDKSFVTAGGLTRVALRKGSLIVNSSQGGGSKDTWIVDRNA